MKHISRGRFPPKYPIWQLAFLKKPVVCSKQKLTERKTWREGDHQCPNARSTAPTHWPTLIWFSGATAAWTRTIMEQRMRCLWLRASMLILMKETAADRNIDCEIILCSLLPLVPIQPSQAPLQTKTGSKCHSSLLLPGPRFHIHIKKMRRY